MKNYPYFAALVASTTAIFSAQLVGVLNLSQTQGLQNLGNFGILTSVIGTLPANAQSTVPVESPSTLNQTLLISQSSNSLIRFVPPADKSTRRSQGSGSRGCDQSLPENLVTLLIPSKDYIGQTTSSHPTFFWNLSQSVSVPIQFTLVERGVAEPLFAKQIDSPAAGMMKLELPKDKPGLVSGRAYKWSVTLICNARRPSANPYFYSWIERVPTPPELEQKLGSMSSSSNSLGQTISPESANQERELALIYAQKGLWYDALASIAEAQAKNPNDLYLQEDFRSLLSQAKLINMATPEQEGIAYN
jgi:hypothetical protein